MGILLGSETAWRVRRAGELGISYQWLNGEPCMFVYPYRKPGAGAMAVPIESAHLWANSDGHPNLHHAIAAAMRGAEAMGLSAINPTTIRRIVDAVIDGLPDLLDMPPERTTADIVADAVGELTIKIDGKTVKECEVPA